MKTLSSPLALIKHSFEIFFEKENFKYLAKIYAWLIPFQIFMLYQNYFVSAQSRVLDTTNTFSILTNYPLFFLLVVIVNLGFLIASFLIDLAGVKAIGGVVSKTSLQYPELLKYAKSKFWPFALLTVTAGLIQVFGFILLVIPGIIFSVWFAFVKFVFVEKGLGVRASLKASRDLSSGRFWKVLGRLAVLVIFVILMQTFFALVPFGIGPVIFQLFAALQLLPFYLLYKELAS